MPTGALLGAAHRDAREAALKWPFPITISWHPLSSFPLLASLLLKALEIQTFHVVCFGSSKQMEICYCILRSSCNEHSSPRLMP